MRIPTSVSAPGEIKQMRPIEIDVLATNEKASGPGYILATGGVAWAEDVFIERPEGECRPFS